MYDIVTFGNAVVDVFLSIHHASDFCRIDEQEQELCVRYGEKIPLEQGTFLLGGNACNVAVGMSRLGFRAALIAELGSDEFAQKIRTGLQAEGVSTEYLHQTDTGSSFSIALNFAGERTLFVEHVERKHAFAYDGLRTPWFYITSLGVDWRPAYAAVIDFAQQAGSRIAFSPGTPQLQEGTSGILPMLRQTEYLFVSRSEATRILGEPALGASTKEVLLRLQGLGPRNVSDDQRRVRSGRAGRGSASLPAGHHSGTRGRNDRGRRQFCHGVLGGNHAGPGYADCFAMGIGQRGLGDRSGGHATGPAEPTGDAGAGHPGPEHRPSRPRRLALRRPGNRKRESPVIIGVPKEIMAGERRVALVPERVSYLVSKGHQVLLETGAGAEAFFDDGSYTQAEAQIVPDPRTLYAKADLVLKVRAPAFDPDSEADEIDLLREGTVLVALLESAYRA